MPDEWNEVIASMQNYEKTNTPHGSENYHQATKDEISSPKDFPYPAGTHAKYLRKQSSVHIRTGKEDHEKGFPNLRVQFETKKKNTPVSTKSHDVKWKSKAQEDPEDEYAHLQEHWQHDYDDIMNGTKEELPPWQEVNHEINLIDPDKRCHYYLPRCPNSLREQFHKKINRYVDTGWWEPRVVSQAVHMLCIPKKDAKLCTVVDA
jgi:hypothetical protein